MVRSLIAGLSVGLLGACSLFVSTDGLGGDATADGGRTDRGATDTSEAGGNELTGGRDGGALADADAGSPATDGSASSFCKSQSPAPTFCEDFDQGPLDLSRWAAVVTEGVGLLTLEGVRTASAPGALRTSVRKSATVSFPPAFLVERLGRPTTTLRFEADVYVERWEAKPNDTRILAFQLGSGSDFAASPVVSLAILGEGAVLCSEEYKDGTGSHFASHGQKTVAFNHWMHVTLTIGLPARSVTILVDDVKITDGTTIEGPLKDGDMSAYLGLYYSVVGNTGWDVLFDNVVIDAK